MGLLHFIKKNEEVRKIFGKRELKIIEKQLLGINLTQSEKNRLSRDIRIKLDVINKLSEFDDEFKLKKGSEIKKIIGDAKEIILEDELFNNIKEIILFGSVVENELTFRSDIDIAVKLCGVDKKKAVLFRMRILRRVGGRVDVQIYELLPKRIKREIDEKGKILYRK